MHYIWCGCSALMARFRISKMVVERIGEVIVKQVMNFGLTHVTKNCSIKKLNFSLDTKFGGSYSLVQLSVASLYHSAEQVCQPLF